MPAFPDEGLALDQRDDLVAEWSIEECGSGVKILDDLILALNSGTALLSSHKHDRGENFLVGILVNRAFNSIWQGRRAAVHGYPVQAMILARSALEDWATMRWVENHPDDKDLWLCRIVAEVEPPLDEKGRERWVPKIDTMLREIDEGESPLVAYEALSKVAHPRGIGLAWEFRFDEESVSLHVGGRREAVDLRRSLFHLVRVAAGILPCVERLQGRWLDDVDADWVSDGAELVERAQQFLLEVAGELPQDDPTDDRDD